MERFEPSTLSGLVFETSAYTVPPHRLVLAFLPHFTAFSSLSMMLEKSPKQARKPPKQVKDTHKRIIPYVLLKSNVSKTSPARVEGSSPSKSAILKRYK